MWLATAVPAKATTNTVTSPMMVLVLPMARSLHRWQTAARAGTDGGHGGEHEGTGPPHTHAAPDRGAGGDPVVRRSELRRCAGRPGGSEHRPLRPVHRHRRRPRGPRRAGGVHGRHRWGVPPDVEGEPARP